MKLLHACNFIMGTYFQIINKVIVRQKVDGMVTLQHHNNKIKISVVTIYYYF